MRTVVPADDWFILNVSLKSNAFCIVIDGCTDCLVECNSHNQEPVSPSFRSCSFAMDTLASHLPSLPHEFLLSDNYNKFHPRYNKGKL
jgi:hypothetical protein